MVSQVSVIINTLNEEKNIARAINSIKGLADEIIVCDMHSDDDTAVIAKRLGAKIIFHKRTGYVEPARNFAISKASHEWILILDADEEAPQSLTQRLKEMIDKPIVSTFVEIPRKNLIFAKWIKASMWWPDYNIRFFKKGSVTWSDKIHSRPKTQGQGLTLPDEERFALIHHHYDSLDQFVQRMNNYSQIQAKELVKAGYQFNWRDLIAKPLGEFLSRYFANYGFKDGIHGLALALLQAFSFILVYLRAWEMEKFPQAEVSLSELKELKSSSGYEINYWFKESSLSKNPVKRLLQKATRKIAG